MENNNQIQSKKKKVNSNRQVMKIAYLFLVIFVAMGAYYLKFLLVDGDDAINNPYNKRSKILAETVVRGDILSNDGSVLAETKINQDGTETRNYPYGSMFAHVVGYSTYGQTGLELQANYKLLSSNSPVTDQVLNDITGKKQQGDSIVTTLDVNLQRAAYEAIGTNDAAVIAIEPSTGKVLAMVSQPDFNPNKIADYYEQYSDSEGSNLLNRATNGLYTPGSTFKFFTLYEYIRENNNYLKYTYNCAGKIDIDEYSLKCANGKIHGEEDIYDAFAYSCNSAFVNLGMTLDKSKLNRLCTDLLFNSSLPVNFPYKKSRFSLNSDSDTFETMQTVIGQGKTLVSPLHLAMIASAVANDGVLMKPYLISQVQNSNGNIIKSYKPKKYKQLISKDDTKILRKFMEEVVDYGTANVLNGDAYEAYGKTGTAQIKDGSRNNSLFMGYAEKEGKQIAICVVLENMPEGSMSAVPVAKSVFDIYFS